MILVDGVSSVRWNFDDISRFRDLFQAFSVELLGDCYPDDLDTEFGQKLKSRKKVCKIFYQK